MDLDWASFILGLLAGLLLVYLTEFVRPTAQEHNKRLLAWEKKRKADQSKREAAAKSEKFHRRLEAERVGTRWFKKCSPDDPGMEGEVTALDPRSRNRRVLIEWKSPPGREPIENCPEGPAAIEWDKLIEPEDRQRRYTAWQMGNTDDSGGWVRYGRLP